MASIRLAAVKVSSVVAGGLAFGTGLLKNIIFELIKIAAA